MRVLAVAVFLATLSGAVSCQSSGGQATPPPSPASSPAQKPAVLDAFPEIPAVDVKITAKGFVPDAIPAKKGEKLAIAFTRTEEMTCATEAIFDDLGGLEAKLPLNQTVRVSFIVPRSGDLFFGCSMQRMIRGKIVAAGP